MGEHLKTLFSLQSVKAWLAALGVLSAEFTAVSADGNLDGGDIGKLIGVVLVALGVVYAVPNAKAKNTTD